MKGQSQIVHHMVDGDCFRAAIASILELDIHTVPNFLGKPDAWWWSYIEWLQPMNLTMIRFDDSAFRPKGYSIATVEVGNPEIFTWSHAIVCLNGEPVFDPYYGDPLPSYNIKEWTIFQVLDVSKPVVLNPERVSNGEVAS